MITAETTVTYSFEAMRLELAEYRKDKGMRPATLRNWLRELNVIPELNGQYSEQVLDQMKQTSTFLESCRSFKTLRKVLARNASTPSN